MTFFQIFLSFNISASIKLYPTISFELNVRWGPKKNDSILRFGRAGFSGLSPKLSTIFQILYFEFTGHSVLTRVCSALNRHTGMPLQKMNSLTAEAFTITAYCPQLLSFSLAETRITSCTVFLDWEHDARSRNMTQSTSLKEKTCGYYCSRRRWLF